MEELYRQLRPFLLITDISFMSYWLVSALVVAGIVDISTDYLFNDYYNEYVFAWNWSFFPLDVLFAVTGFWSLRLHRLGNPNWLGMALVSMVLTFCAGFMAVSYWALRLEFDPLWWIPNLILVIWPLCFLPRVFSAMNSKPAA